MLIGQQHGRLVHPERAEGRRSGTRETGRREEKQASLPRRLFAETFGTFALVFVAAGADTIAARTNGEIIPVARALAPALMVMALIYAIGNVSGAHFNPVVTL